MSDWSQIPNRVHLIGIGGAGMIGLADCLLDLGRTVSGSDLLQSEDLQRLESRGSKVFRGHSADNVAYADMVVASDAISATNAELQEARLRNLPILKRSAFLNALTKEELSIFVAGSHGKSSTTAMIAKVLDSSGMSPSFYLGASNPSLGNRWGRIHPGSYFVAEACEAFRNLAWLNPNVAVFTNVDDDHLEHYGSQARLDDTFYDFAMRADPERAIILNGDDPGTQRLTKRLTRHTVTFGFAVDNHIRADSVILNESGSIFSVWNNGQLLGNIELRLHGRHMISNALACVATCLSLGIPFFQIVSGLKQYEGLSRRWQDHGLLGGVRLVDDYAHHPAELRACLETAQTLRHTGQPLLIAFQPQLFSRTQRLFQSFADVLVEFDRILLLDIDGGGERNQHGTSAHLIADEIRLRGKSVEMIATVDQLIDRVLQIATSGDLLVVAGAGNIRKAAPELKARLVLRDGEPAQARLFIAPAINAHTDKPEHADPLLQPRTGLLNRLRLRMTRGWFRPASVLALMQNHVQHNPHHPAVGDGQESLSYLQLDAASNLAASVLMLRGVRRSSVVGVTLPSSIDLIVSLIGIMKVGAIYLPIDTDLPRERVGYMLDHSNCHWLIVTHRSRQDTHYEGVERIYANELKANSAQLKNVRRIPGPSAEDIAYICFTSGSTGYPKGVVINHASLVALVLDIRTRFGINADARVAQNTSISFDVSLAEIWMALAGGGELRLTNATKPLVGERFADFLENHCITHLAVTPTVLASIPQRALPILRWIIAAGEACPASLVQIWAPNRNFINAYGPTEATIYATAAHCLPDLKISIGFALDHVETQVLDSQLNAVPPGTPGELCLSGVGVAVGYIGAKQETSPKFCVIQGPKGARRIYRTGDLVKEDLGGALIFLGRLDNQIKIRGHRIEIEEIEHCLQQSPNVIEAAVCIDVRGETKELVCFVKLEDEKLGIDNLRSYLQTWLPDYMVPHNLLSVSCIKHTPSGKKDRQWLLETYGRLIVRRAEYIAPRTDIELRLSQIWKDILPLDDEVGVYDAFTALGGDSLLGLLLVEKIESSFQISLPPGFFSESMNITEMGMKMTSLASTHQNAESKFSGFRNSQIFKQLRNLTSDWTGERANADALIFSHGNNKEATYDLFVCVQCDEEVIFLSRALGNDFRIHAVRSGHLVMDYSDVNVEALTRHYFEEFSAIDPQGILLIAGVCQGCTIARAMSNLLTHEGNPPKLLILIEQARLFSYADPVAFFYSEDSYLNPYRRFENGLARYDQIYQDRYTLDIVPGPHASFHREPYVHTFAHQLLTRLRVLEGVETLSRKNELSNI